MAAWLLPAAIGHSFSFRDMCVTAVRAGSISYPRVLAGYSYERFPANFLLPDPAFPGEQWAFAVGRPGLNAMGANE